MSTGGPDKPGLGDDILAELDAWDRTFDALHDDESLFGGTPAAKPSPDAAFGNDDDDVTRTVAVPHAPPPPAAAPPIAVAPPPAVAPLSEANFDEPTSIAARPIASAFDDATVITAQPVAPSRRSQARTTPPPPPRPAPVVVAPPRPVLPPRPIAAPAPPPRPVTTPVVDETDFSDLGFSGPPEALGSLLGQPPPLPPIEGLSPDVAVAAFDDDEVLTSAVRPESVLPSASVDNDDPFAPSAEDLAQLRREAHQGGAEVTRVASVGADMFEIDETMDRGAARGLPEEVSDPGRDPSDDTFERANRTRILDPDDALLAEAGAAKRPARPGPAIVRRADKAAAPERKRPVSTGGFGADSTRVADLRELEKLARRDDRQSRPTPTTGYAPPPEATADDDFYADIEIGGDEEEVTGTPASARRVTSNVVRRSGDRPQTIAPPVVTATAVATDDDEPEFQLTANDASEPSALAAPVPVDDDLGLDLAMSEFAPETTPVGEVAVPPPPPPVAGPPPVAVALDDAFAALDADEAIVEAIPEPIAESGAFAGDPPPMPAREDIATDDEVGAAAAVDELAIEDELALSIEPAPVDSFAADALQVTTPSSRAITASGESELRAEPMASSLLAVASPSSAVPEANPFADDDSSQTKIGVPPPPLRSSSPSSPPPPRVATVPPIAAIPVTEPTVAPPPAPPVEAPAIPSAVIAPVASAPVSAVLPPAIFAAALPPLELDALDLPEQVDPAAGFDPGEAAAKGILRLERELELIDEPTQQAVLRIEAGRLYERLGDVDRARVSYDAALLADPRATAALRGLRRIARGAGDLAEATTHLDVELGIAGPLERRALALHRVDLLMAASEQDLARVAVGELLDTANGDVRALLAQLELAFLDGRAEELDEALDRLGAVIADAQLRAAVEVARGHLAERRADRPRATAAFASAIAADGQALTGYLGAQRGDDGGAATAALAGRITDPALRAALLLESGAADPASFVAAAEIAGADPTVQAAVLGAAMRSGAPPSPATIAMARAAADPALRRAASLWAAARVDDDAVALSLYQTALDAEPGDRFAAAALADRRLAAGDIAAAAEAYQQRVDGGTADELDRVRAATLFAAIGHADRAAALVPAPSEVDSPAVADAWADVVGALGRATDRAEFLAAMAIRSDERIESRLWLAKSAAAFDRAATPDEPATLTRALAAWTDVVDSGGDAERAYARGMTLAAALGDPEAIAAAWARAGNGAESSAAAATLALARARIALAQPDGWSAADEILREVSADDPRRLAATAVLGAAAGQWADVAHGYEARAAAIAERAPIEAALLRFRAAGLYLDRGNDAARSASLLGAIVDDHPELGFVHDALATARRRLGDAAPPPRATRVDGSRADGFARLVRDGEQLADQGDGVGALALLAKALELRPLDPLAAEPLKRVASSVGEAGPVTSLALAELRLAEAAGDRPAQADAYETLAQLDLALRDDAASALISIEAAAAAEPSRLAVVRELERAYVAAGRWADLVALRDRQLADDGAGPDRVALALDRALLLEKLDRPEDELKAAYQGILAEAPRTRRALFHLEAMVRRAGSSPELVALEDSIAEYFVADPRTRSAFLTRSGETLTDLGRIDDALARFREANQLRGGYAAALEGWRDAALRGQLWIDFADAAAKEAALSDDDATKARLWHVAGVALMDRALAGERAVDALRAALAADPRHTDAFIRLRLLLDEQGEHEALATLLEARLEVETDSGERVALHRAIAELARNFLEDRERAKHHYRAIVEHSPADLRAIAALSDIAWEQGAWGEAADALLARARLERDPGVQRNIHFRLGMIYADRLPDAPAAIRAFQRVLAHDPDDESALERLADLGIASGEWRMALGACERLVKNETVPARKVAHLHRVGRIFAEGFADRRKAERAYQLAVDAAPDSDVALAALIRFYEAAGDAASIRVHLGMVAAAMRQRIATGAEPTAYRVLARVARARHDAGVAGQGAVHRAAVDIARLAGADADAATIAAPDHLGGLLRPEADELVWPPAVSAGLRQMVALLGDRLAKHVGIDLRPYGVTRGDRVRAKDSPVAAAAQEIAEGFGLGEIDVYISSRQPYAMVAEPTSPLSLIIGSAIADGNRLAAVRFAAAGALRLATAQLAILARLPADELGVLVVALLRLFQPELPYLKVDNDQVGAQLQRLRRLIPSGLLAELRPHALAIDPASFDHLALHRGLEQASHRAGLVAAGGAAAPLAILMARAGAPDLATGTRDPVIAALIQFAVSDDYAALAALCQA